ncbi:SOS response-associated peptidase [Marinobacterium aestuariivivens]|uniref:Abasic site processing protein n=1 Tax=Marinobacterium aestuariivivens TaxID=1698799 RepID=A0ABW2A7U1_9GAMM
MKTGDEPETGTMCGRYNIIDDPFTRDLLEALDIEARLTTRYNIAPTEEVPVIRRREDHYELVSMHWWLIPSWVREPGTRYSMFNARAETLNESPAFRAPFRHQRCIVPASSFIEWHTEPGGKQPWLIRPCDGAIAFAGIWDHWGQGQDSILSCCIVTCEAVAQFRDIHNRMPVMLRPDQFERWLDPASDSGSLLPWLLPQLPGPFELWPIDPHINNARHKETPVMIGDRRQIRDD